MKYRILCLMLCLCLLAGCAPAVTPSTYPERDWNSSELSQQQLFSELFNINNKISLRLDMSDEELAKMQSDYEKYDRNGSKSPIYRMADLYITITTAENETYSYKIEEVGVRMKGNTSRTDFYSQKDGIYNLIHLKLSFQETFDDASYYGAEAKQWEEDARKKRKNRTFATLEKLDLRWNRCDDSSYLKEYFAYETYRQYGVMAPHTNLASFDWAGIHMGVYTINEPVDEIFLEKNLPAEALGGDLYKIGWAGYSNGSFTDMNSVGIENEDSGKFYAYDLKTNRKTSSHETLANLVKALNSRDVSKEAFAQLVDLDSFLPFCAVSYLLGNPDDLRNNYNNCYIYFRGDNQKLVVIPYDFDRCLGVTTHWNPTGNGVTGDNPFSLKLNADNTEQRSPLILYSVAAGGYYVREYAALLEQIASGSWFTYKNFAALYEIAEYNYAGLTAPGKVFRNAGGLYLRFDLERTSDFSSNGNISFREYLQAKLETLEFYLADVDKYAQQTPNVPAQWYIRADATNWQNDSDFAMREEDGLITLRFTTTKQIRLKVYHDISGQWFGSECVSEDCAVAYDTDDHTNIILQAGSYRITFDPETEMINIEKE